MSRPQEHSAHGTLYGDVTDAFQGFLEGLITPTLAVRSPLRAWVSARRVGEGRPEIGSAHLPVGRAEVPRIAVKVAAASNPPTAFSRRSRAAVSRIAAITLVPESSVHSPTLPWTLRCQAYTTTYELQCRPAQRMF
jgi:hypothetical protein